MTSLAIRAAKIKDIPSIVEVRQAALTEDEIRGFSAYEFPSYYSDEELRKAWAEGNKLKDGFEVFIAEEDGIMVGFIVIKIEDKHGSIDNIVVARERQRKGIGRALVEYVEGITLSKGLYLMKTDTTENADGVPWKAYSFWTRMGYEDTGERLPTKWEFKEIPLFKRLK
ncbi:MAG: GNAT family N-acetyltransferase [Candidatus Bathyarchaeota archaeon]|nr:GNAT family N-acetyltransferase [Candidatus Bathyarchaeota archaeon]